MFNITLFIILVSVFALAALTAVVIGYEFGRAILKQVDRFIGFSEYLQLN